VSKRLLVLTLLSPLLAGASLAPAPQSKPRFVHNASVPLKDLAPGDYTLRLEVASRMGKRPMAFREVSFTVMEPPAGPSTPR